MTPDPRRFPDARGDKILDKQPSLGKTQPTLIEKRKLIDLLDKNPPHPCSNISEPTNQMTSFTWQGMVWSQTVLGERDFWNSMPTRGRDLLCGDNTLQLGVGREGFYRKHLPEVWDVREIIKRQNRASVQR